MGGLVDFAASRRATVRFIELMPFALGPEWKRYYLPREEMLARLADRVDPTPLDGGSGPATYFRLPNGRGAAGRGRGRSLGWRNRGPHPARRRRETRRRTLPAARGLPVDAPARGVENGPCGAGGASRLWRPCPWAWPCS